MHVLPYYCPVCSDFTWVVGDALGSCWKMMTQLQNTTFEACGCRTRISETCTVLHRGCQWTRPWEKSFNTSYLEPLWRWYFWKIIGLCDTSWQTRFLLQPKSVEEKNYPRPAAQLCTDKTCSSKGAAHYETPDARLWRHGHGVYAGWWSQTNAVTDIGTFLSCPIHNW